MLYDRLGGRGALPAARTLDLARRANGLWYAELAPHEGAPVRTLRARALVNATGPWVARFLAERLQMPAPGVRLVKGVHIVVPRLSAHPDAYALPNDDGRLLFVIPYEQSFSLIGTTAEDYQDEPAAVAASDMDILYLCQAVSRYLRQPVHTDQVIWSYAGVRPRDDDGRDDLLELDAPAGDAPLLSIWGGRMTTYRQLAERALARLQPVLGFERGAWTAGATLPGGDLPASDFDRFLRVLRDERPWLPAPLARRYARAYGTRVERLLNGAGGLEALGEPLGQDLYEAEVGYLVRAEWAQTGEDILFRRSKLGLHVDARTRAGLDDWLARNRGGAARSADLQPDRGTR